MTWHLDYVTMHWTVARTVEMEHHSQVLRKVNAIHPVLTVVIPVGFLVLVCPTDSARFVLLEASSWRSCVHVVRDARRPFPKSSPRFISSSRSTQWLSSLRICAQRNMFAFPLLSATIPISLPTYFTGVADCHGFRYGFICSLKPVERTKAQGRAEARL